MTHTYVANTEKITFPCSGEPAADLMTPFRLFSDSHLHYIFKHVREKGSIRKAISLMISEKTLLEIFRYRLGWENLVRKIKPTTAVYRSTIAK